ncbi:prolyl oligopeptidase family serine peptidase [Paenibacillus sp. HJL G12]|uniref:Prolyl oligopeptidase family serine peptidase n=1 Tax=Paenibacillus dendrobii TaxID=2691084 RepID=A0A7X3IJG0_9BACL|nr:alpha/beta hydrolase-fold protein [Paenibacillus dendrobii]MWV43142.1 prolyl oligopeptidase family serine peptidase [Paenibacillus dendrobii]
MRLNGLAAACVLLLGLTAAGCANEKPAQAPAEVSAVNENVNDASVNSSVEPVHAEVLSTHPNLQKVTFLSASLSKEMKFNIYLPDEYDTSKKYPVLYLIHGYGSNENMWMPDLGMEHAASQLLSEGKINPLIIVSPQIGNSYGFNSESEGNYSDYLIKDLIPYVDEHFSTESSKKGRMIGGLSMGGWAALYNAFQQPDLFSKVGGHSPALWMDDWGNTGDLKQWLYPSDSIRKGRDPLMLADEVNLEGVSVYLDCGNQDSYKFYQGTKALYKKLHSSGVTSEYHHSEGGHDGEYWKNHVRDYLLFYAGK